MVAHARVHWHALDCAVLGEPAQAHPARLDDVGGPKFSDCYAVADASVQGGDLVDLGAFFVRELAGRVLDAADQDGGGV
ncbi:hypothetical protein [Streptomyces sp. NPDC004270]